MRAVALAYIDLGIPVLPLWHVLPDGNCACGNADHVPGGRGEREIAKHPRNRAGVSRASRDRRQVSDWWWRWPHAGIGLATGHRLDAIDVDDPAALTGLADLLAAGRIPTPIGYQRTGRAGGVHVVVPASGMPSGQAVLPGVDVRGRGGYVVAAPTVHRSRVAYAWTPIALPVGDAETGGTFPLLPWEVTTSTGAGPREGAWAQARLGAQARTVARTTAGERNVAVYSAGVAMGAAVHAGWIVRSDAVRVLLAAAEQAGADPMEATRSVDRGLAVGARGTLPTLRDQIEMSVEDVVGSIRAWVASGAARSEIGGRSWGSAETVLSWLLGEAERTGSRRVVAAARSVEAGCGLGRNASAKALTRLVNAGAVSRVSSGSQRATTGAIYVLLPQSEFVAREDTVVAKPLTPYGGVSSLATGGAASPSVLAHDAWGRSRGLGRGLTGTDRRLLCALPPDGSPLRTADWAAAGGVHRVTASAALRPEVAGTLGALGLIMRPIRGQVAATAAGQDLIRALTGIEDLSALDDLAKDLGVTGRAQTRRERIADEREAHGRLLLGARVQAAVGGREGEVRDEGLVARHLGDRGHASLSVLLGVLDGHRKAVRRAAVQVLTALTMKSAVSDDSRADLAAAEVGPDLLASVAAAVMLSGRPTAVDPGTGEVLDAVRLAQIHVSCLLRFDGLLSIAEETARLEVAGLPMRQVALTPSGYAPLAWGQRSAA